MSSYNETSVGVRHFKSTVNGTIMSIAENDVTSLNFVESPQNKPFFVEVFDEDGHEELPSNELYEKDLGGLEVVDKDTPPVEVEKEKPVKRAKEKPAEKSDDGKGSVDLE